MSLFLMLLIGCNGCRPHLPSDDANNDTQDSDEDTDTGDTQADTETADTTPELPPRCDLMEVEPNNSLDESMVVPMTQWVCGAYQETENPFGDVDFLSFTNTEAGWLEVSEECASRGSSADCQFILFNDTLSLTSLGSYLSTDPKVVVPIDTLDDWGLVLGETTFASGDDYGWALKTQMVKAPVEWSFTEAEPNDTTVLANSFTVGETVYGTISSASDYDWYHVVTPKDADRIVFTVEAYRLGSPLDVTLVLYAADGTTRLRTDSTGEVDYDPDPWFEWRQTASNDWYLLVRSAADQGTSLHWYTLNIRGETDG